MSKCNFEFLPHLVLPTVYGNALSYYEEIQCLCNKINEVIDIVNNIGDDFTDKAYKYTDQQIEILKQLIYNKYDAEISDINNDLLQLHVSLGELVVIINDLESKLDSKFDLLTKYLINYIDEHIATITTLYVISPITGELENINKVLEDMFYIQQYTNALTANEYDSMQLTASQYDSRLITALRYLLWGKWIFHDELFNTMFSPFTGLRQNVKTIIQQLADLHRTGALTAIAYDNLRLTADAYDALLLTAYNYDFNGITKRRI